MDDFVLFLIFAYLPALYWPKIRSLRKSLAHAASYDLIAQNLPLHFANRRAKMPTFAHFSATQNLIYQYTAIALFAKAKSVSMFAERTVKHLYRWTPQVPRQSVVHSRVVHTEGYLVDSQKYAVYQKGIQEETQVDFDNLSDIWKQRGLYWYAQQCVGISWCFLARSMRYFRVPLGEKCKHGNRNVVRATTSNNIYAPLFAMIETCNWQYKLLQFFTLAIRFVKLYYLYQFLCYSWIWFWIFIPLQFISIDVKEVCKDMPYFVNIAICIGFFFLYWNWKMAICWYALFIGLALLTDEIIPVLEKVKQVWHLGRMPVFVAIPVVFLVHQYHVPVACCLAALVHMYKLSMHPTLYWHVDYSNKLQWAILE